MREMPMPETKTAPAADPLFDTLDTIGSPIFVVERVGATDFAIVHLNRYFQLVAGLDPRAMTQGPVRDVLPPRLAQYMTENYERVLAEPDPVSKDETYRFGTETHLWRNTMSRAPRSPEGRERIIGVAVPIDDLADRAAALSAEVADLRECLEEFRTLARLAAHDLRAPLANIQSLAELVLEDFADLGDGKAGMIRTCGEVAETALGSLGTLMDRFRPDLPTGLPQDELDLHELCRGIVTLADPSGRLDIAYPAARIACDATVLAAAIRNLVDNAARYAAARIEIRLSTEPATGRLLVSVADDGPGVAAGPDPIARARSGEIRPDGRGYGLGAVMRLLASRGGELRTAPSRLGGGATFEILLPGRLLAGGAPRRARPGGQEGSRQRLTIG